MTSLGVRHVKVKVGRPDDFERLTMVRRLMGPGIDLRVDANGAWTRTAAEAWLAAAAPFGLSAVEQPVPAEDVEGLRWLRGRFEPMILADEAVCRPDDGRTLIEAGAVDGFNLKLSKCGGFTRCVQLAEMARQNGMVCQLGSQVAELGILSAAGRHLALAEPALLYLEGSLTRFVVGRDVICEDLSRDLFAGGRPLNGPGLGITIDSVLLAPAYLTTIF
jgi:muconate cycloisomerase